MTVLQDHPAEVTSGSALTALGGVFLILEGFGIHVDPKVIEGSMVVAGWLALVISKRRVKKGTGLSATTQELYAPASREA